MSAYRRIRSLDALLPPAPRLLLLGSMPSAASLSQRRYYAHPRNAFWPIMARVVGFPASLSYAQRVARLMDAGIGLWDVLACCERRGSLDAGIRPASEQPNPVGAVLAAHATLRAVFFNGAKAESAFRRHLLPGLSAPVRARLHIERLPSSSPAHASLRFEQKRAHWHRALQPFL